MVPEELVPPCSNTRSSMAVGLAFSFSRKLISATAYSVPDFLRRSRSSISEAILCAALNSVTRSAIVGASAASYHATVATMSAPPRFSVNHVACALSASFFVRGRGCLRSK